MYLLLCISAQLFPLSAAARQPEGDREFSLLHLLGCMFLPGVNQTGPVSHKQPDGICPLYTRKYSQHTNIIRGLVGLLKRATFECII